MEENSFCLANIRILLVDYSLSLHKHLVVKRNLVSLPKTLVLEDNSLSQRDWVVCGTKYWWCRHILSLCLNPMGVKYYSCHTNTYLLCLNYWWWWSGKKKVISIISWWHTSLYFYIQFDAKVQAVVNAKKVFSNFQFLYHNQNFSCKLLQTFKKVFDAGTLITSIGCSIIACISNSL